MAVILKVRESDNGSGAGTGRWLIRRRMKAEKTNTAAMANIPTTAHLLRRFICRCRTTNIGRIPMVKSVAIEMTP